MTDPDWPRRAPSRPQPAGRQRTQGFGTSPRDRAPDISASVRSSISSFHQGSSPSTFPRAAYGYPTERLDGAGSPSVRERTTRSEDSPRQRASSRPRYFAAPSKTWECWPSSRTVQPAHVLTFDGVPLVSVHVRAEAPVHASGR